MHFDPSLVLHRNTEPKRDSSKKRRRQKPLYLRPGFFLRFRFGDRKEILRDRLEEFERPFSIDVISGHYILRDRWRNLRDRFGPSKHLKRNTAYVYRIYSIVSRG